MDHGFIPCWITPKLKLFPWRRRKLYWCYIWCSLKVQFPRKLYIDIFIYWEGSSLTSAGKLKTSSCLLLHPTFTRLGFQLWWPSKQNIILWWTWKMTLEQSFQNSDLNVISCIQKGNHTRLTNPGMKCIFYFSPLN
jgi:hypothetical protein